MKIPPTRIYIPDEDKEWILAKTGEVLSSGILTEGPFCQMLEKELSNYLGAKHVVVTNSGTGALEAMLRAFPLKGDVIVPTETFSATIYSVLRSGNKPRFADSGADASISLDGVKKALTRETKAVMLVHIGGFISDSAVEIREFCEKRGLAIFEDAAQAMGSKYDGKSPGAFGRSAGFSLFPTKVMASAEGGFVATNDENLAGTVKLLKDQGKADGNYCSVQGYNWRMSELQAIVALTQLRRLEQFIKTREEAASVYDRELGSGRFTGRLTKLRSSNKCRANLYKYIVLLTRHQRAEVKKRLKDDGISLSGEVYEVPCHTQGAFKELGYKKGDFPIAEEFCDSHICFPLTARMNQEQASFFVDCLDKVLA